MRTLRFLLLSFTALTVIHVSAFDESSLKTKTGLLVNTMKAKHVTPRQIDATFAADVNRYLLQSLDPRNLLFTAEDEKGLTTMAEKIPQDISAGTFQYLHAVDEIFRARIIWLQTVNTEFASRSIMYYSQERVADRLLEHRATSANHRKLFETYLQLSVYSSIYASRNNYSIPVPTDSLKVLGEKYRKSVTAGYTELFKELDSDPEFLAEAWLDAIALTFDPHSHYFSPAAKNDFVAELQSEREIFGLSWDADEEGNIVVENVVPGSNAWMSDQIHEGDKLLKVRFGSGQWIDLSGGEMSAVKLRKLFNENTARVLDFVVESEGKTETVHLEKSAVYSDADILKNAVIPSEKKYGYIYLPDFYTNWTDDGQLGCANDLAKCILKLQKENIDGVILDLRGNGGGSLKEAIDIVGIFIDYGPVLGILDREKKVTALRDFNRGSIWNGPLMVLVDEGSASASEIVAGAVQDYQLGPVVGRPSFGKATSQQFMPMDQTGLTDANVFGYAHVTEGILYRVDQSTNQIRGVIPDVLLPYAVEEPNDGLERHYQNALVAPAIDKKFTYTPKEQDFSSLKNIVETRRNSDVEFQLQMKVIAELRNLGAADTLTSLNWVQYEKDHNAYRKKYEELEQKLEGTPAPFMPESNQFDRELLATDAILKKYNDSFLQRTAEDIELREAVKIFNDWFRTNK